MSDCTMYNLFFSSGERVQFSQAISTSEARGAVEKWLLQVQQVTKFTNFPQLILAVTIASFPSSKNDVRTYHHSTDGQTDMHSNAQSRVSATCKNLEFSLPSVMFQLPSGHGDFSEGCN